MATKPRRSLAEYKKDVGEARLRRKLKEAQNRMALKHHGIMYMKSEQDLLMKCIHTETRRQVKSSTHVMQDNVVPMQSIVVDVETKPSQELPDHEVVTKMSTDFGDSVANNRPCGRIVLHNFIG